MAWIEQRRRRYVVINRIEGAKVKGPSYADRADAELFVRLVDLAGWDAAQAYVAQEPPAEQPAAPQPERTIRDRAVAAGALDDPTALPVTDPALPPPPGREPSGISVGELVRRYIDGRVVRPGTQDQYRSYVRDHVDPYFGDLDAAYVLRQAHPRAEGTSAKDVVAWRAWLAQRPVLTRSGSPTGRTLAPKTVKNIMSLVASAFDTAMTDDFAPLVAVNPVTGMSPTQTAPDDIERVFLSPRQFQALYEHTIGHYRNLLLFLVLTGLRWGEAAGLRVRDVCLSPEHGRPYLEVRTALKRVRGGTVLGLLKSRAARRRLTIPAALVWVIEYAIAGKDPDDLVFTSPQGCRLHHGNVSRNLIKAVRRARAAGYDLPDLALHALRHSCAAWLLSAGRTPYQVSRQLGHETEATTQKYYGHLVRTEYDANADALQGFLSQTGWDLADRVPIEVAPTPVDDALTVIETTEVMGDEDEVLDPAA
jgi:integrase